MAVSAEALNILLTLQGVPTYVGGMQEASGANDEFAASSKRAGAASNEASAASEKQAGASSLVGRAMKASGILIAAAMVEGVKMAIGFNRQMEMLHTQAGASQAEVERLKGAVLGLAGAVPQSPLELAKGLYHFESIGLRGAAAMNALKIAAQGAAVGDAKLEDTATALGAAWIVGAKHAGNLHNVMAILNATVGAGNMRMEELVQSLGSGIIPMSKIAHLSIQDIGAALATLTDSGYSASSAMAQLGTALHFIYAPTAKAKKALESIGLTGKQLFTEMSGPNGLHGALVLLKTHLASAGGAAEQAEKLGEILPGGRGKVLMSLIEELDRLDMKKKQIIATSGNFDESVKRTMEQPAVRIQKAWSSFQATLIRLGSAMEGPATAALVVFAGALGGVLKVLLLVTDKGKLLVPVIIGLAGAFALYKGAVIGAALAQWGYNAAVTAMAIAALIPEITSLADAWFLVSAAMSANPVGLVALAFAALGAAVYLLITHFKEVTDFLTGSAWGIATAVVGGLVAAFLAYKLALIAATAVQWAFNVAMDANPIGLIALAIVALIAGLVMLILHFKEVVNFLRGPWGTVLVLMMGPAISFPLLLALHFKKVKQIFMDLINWIGGAWGKVGHYLAAPFEYLWGKVEWVIKQIKKGLHDIINAPGSVLKSITGGINSLNIPGMPSFAEGGTMTSAGFASINENMPGETVWLPGGASVAPSPASSIAVVRPHTPTPSPQEPTQQLLIEAYLELPAGAGRSLYKLITKQAAIKAARA
jgi:TP901 family phage tail tape measure protein